MISVVNRHHHSNEITEDASESSWTAPLSRYCGLRCQTVKLWHIPANHKQPNKEITKTPWRWRRLWEGKREAGVEQGKKTWVCVCVCVYERGWGLWRETTVNYAFTHHITGQLKLEQSCVNRVKTNRLNSLQDRKVWTRAAIPHAARQINYSAFVNSTAVSLICIMGPRYRPHFPMQTWRLNAALLRSVFREWCFSLHQ